MDQPNFVTRDLLLRRWGQLKTERAGWIPHWQEISTKLLPRSGRFFATDRNKGDKRHNAIYDSTGTWAHGVLAAGLMSGATSPARPWFRLAIADKDLMGYAPVKLWLSQVQQVMMSTFARSNTYLSLHNLYQDLGSFGTGCTVLESDPRNVSMHYPLSVGEFCLAQDERGVVDTMYREFQMTVAQMVKKFGLDACSPMVQNLYSQGGLDKWVSVVHAVEPRSARDPRKLDNKNMPYQSVYFELGGNGDKVLSESGYRTFPVLAPRWDKRSGDIYGHSPAMMALGDINQLQHQQLRKGQVIDKQTNPPLQIPITMKNRDVDTLPGGISYYDSNAQNGVIRTAFDVNLRLDYLLQDIQDVRSRVERAFHTDLFLMLANDGGTGRMTATEVAERHEEKLLILGPVLERLHFEMLDPLIDITFMHAVESGRLPPAPPELQGMELAVEYVSMLAQAQKAIGTNSIDRFTNSLGTVASIKPEVLDNFDADAWAQVYSDLLNVDPRFIVPGDKVALIRQQKAQMLQQQQQQLAMQQAADTARSLSQAQTTQPSALNNVMDMFQGYGSGMQ